MSSVSGSSSSSWLVEIFRACCGSRRTVIAKASEITLEIQKYIEELEKQTTADKEKIKSLKDTNKLREKEIEVLKNLLDKDETFQKTNEIVSNTLVPKINTRNQKLADLAEAEEAAKKEEEAAAEEEKMQQVLLNMLNQNQNPRRRLPVQNTNNNTSSNRVQFQTPVRSQPSLNNTNYSNFYSNNNNNSTYQDELDGLLGNYDNSDNSQIPYYNNNINNVNHSGRLQDMIDAVVTEFNSCKTSSINMKGWDRAGHREQVMTGIVGKYTQSEAVMMKILNGLPFNVKKQLPAIFRN